MKNILFIFLIKIYFINSVFTQSYTQGMLQFREYYINEFRTDENSPLKEKDLKHLKFFEIDSTYHVTGNFKSTPDEKPFDMPTSSGKIKQYVKYGTVKFQLQSKEYTLSIYQSLTLRETEEYADHLFIPFNDETNYEETYGGGRYLDLKLRDIKDNLLIIDFNKCYNPYCVYTDGYSCPVPPSENKLAVRIEAGEKMFGKKQKH
ncbi:MAG: DUF1684 domain-containing protein [Fimbriimonadaceae bacterium]|nr:DUF1684 domain-containing protein [Chitinophagales bacterium]